VCCRSPSAICIPSSVKTICAYRLKIEILAILKRFATSDPVHQISERTLRFRPRGHIPGYQHWIGRQAAEISSKRERLCGICKSVKVDDILTPFRSPSMHKYTNQFIYLTVYEDQGTSDPIGSVRPEIQEPRMMLSRKVKPRINLHHLLENRVILRKLQRKMQCFGKFHEFRSQSRPML
jgi:hypothetical protein